MNKIVSSLGCDPVATCVWTPSSGLLSPEQEEEEEGGREKINAAGVTKTESEAEDSQ